jgi:two-component system, NarL family, sensor histidine kinase DesK
VREGTTNVIRQSDCSHCRITVRAGLAGAEVEIVDDGRAAGEPAAGAGLAGLRERARALAGRTEAGARADGGFRMLVSVPKR